MSQNVIQITPVLELLECGRHDRVYDWGHGTRGRARKLGTATRHSMSERAQHQRLQDNNAVDVTPQDMLGELCADNQQLTRFLRATHAVCDEYHDVATASLIENWIDETERRTWFLAEITGNL